VHAASTQINPGAAELCERRAISAAYYTVSHAARRYRAQRLLHSGVSQHEILFNVDHDVLWRWAKNDGVKTRILITCNTLRSARNKADYEIQLPVQDDPARCLERATSIIQEFEALEAALTEEES
jgi:uncharacterized protein (UPF0332 family)